MLHEAVNRDYFSHSTGRRAVWPAAMVEIGRRSLVHYPLFTMKSLLGWTLPLVTIAATIAPTQAAVPGGSRFEDYRVPVYRGASHAPDFTGPGRRYRNLRTNISLGFAQGRRFAGHFVLFGIGCGTGCVSVTLGDLKTGRIYDFPLGGEDNSMLRFQVRPDSRLVKAHWEKQDGPRVQCVFEDVLLTGTTFTRRQTGVHNGNCPSEY